MDRKKPPALTSPWKVGFLVALMLIVTGLGVGYFISGTFGLKWQWIHLGGASPNDWVFRLGPFIEEMVPLIALVTLLAVASYVLVAGAVSRYTRFVDSGVEYKQLLKSIKTVDDLEDEERLEKLKQHPELREFLLGFKKRMAARERQNEKRSGAAREAQTPALAFPAETALLVSAIMNGAAGFSRELALTIPELKQIERAAREHLSKDAPPAADLESLRNRVDATVDAVRSHCVGIRRDADACVSGVREMETLLGQLTRAIETPQESMVATEGITAAARELDAMAETLNELGEETRRIAIAAALEASGGGGDGQSIRVADEVRTIATRFNTVAAQWKQAGPALRTSISTIAQGTSSNGQHRKSLAATAAKAAAGAQKWGERLVALLEQVRELERAAGVEGGAAAPREWGTIDTGFDDDATVAVEPNVPAAGDHDAPAEDSAAAAPEVTDTEEQFETVSHEHVFESDRHEHAPFADIPGFEREQRVFNESMAAPVEALAVEQNAGDDHQVAAERETESAEAISTTPEPLANDDGFLTGPRASAPTPRPEPVEKAAPPRRAKTKVAPVVVEDEVEDEDGRIDIDADIDVDADAVDLYAFGAVDFVEGVHA